MCGLFAHIHPVRPLAAVDFGPVLVSGSLIQLVGCEKARGQCCHGDGDSARWRAGCPAGRGDPVWSDSCQRNPRSSCSRRRTSRPAALLTVGSAEPAVIWTGSERVSTAISRGASISFGGTKQTVSESRQPTQNTHTTLKWIYNEHTLALRTLSHKLFIQT